MQRDHSLLANGFAAHETGLHRLDRLAIDAAQQTLGLGPCLLGGVPSDHVEPNAEAHLAAALFRQSADPGNFLGTACTGSPQVR